MDIKRTWVSFHLQTRARGKGNAATSSAPHPIRAARSSPRLPGPSPPLHHPTPPAAMAAAAPATTSSAAARPSSSSSFSRQSDAPLRAATVSFPYSRTRPPDNQIFSPSESFLTRPDFIFPLLCNLSTYVQHGRPRWLQALGPRGLAPSWSPPAAGTSGLWGR